MRDRVHVVCVQKAVGQLHRVLRPGGFLQHETPCFTYNPYYKDPQYAGAGDAMRCDEGAKQLPSGRTREDRICSQQDHIWAFRCGHLLKTFETAGFECTSSAVNMSLADHDRFLSRYNGAQPAAKGKGAPPSSNRGEYLAYVARSQGYSGRFRCIKAESHHTRHHKGQHKSLKTISDLVRWPR